MATPPPAAPAGDAPRPVEDIFPAQPAHRRQPVLRLCGPDQDCGGGRRAPDYFCISKWRSVYSAGLHLRFVRRRSRGWAAESPFGREFDSLADLISFGVPAFLVHRIVLKDVRSGARGIRLVHRLHLSHLRRASAGPLQCPHHPVRRRAGRDFLGFHSSAAALVASLTLHDVVGRQAFVR